MRLRYLLIDWLTAVKHRQAFETAQRLAAWKVEKRTAPRVTAPLEQRRQWRKVLRFKRTA